MFVEIQTNWKQSLKTGGCSISLTKCSTLQMGHGELLERITLGVAWQDMSLMATGELTLLYVTFTTHTTGTRSSNPPLILIGTLYRFNISDWKRNLCFLSYGISIYFSFICISKKEEGKFSKWPAALNVVYIFLGLEHFQCWKPLSDFLRKVNKQLRVN